ncbi:MAG: hypothetical protein ACWGPR_11575 [Candidatus Deferrimicrobiaceae bacterium]
MRVKDKADHAPELRERLRDEAPWLLRGEPRPRVGDVVRQEEPIDWATTEVAWLECMHSGPDCVTWRVVAKWTVDR